MFKWKVKKEFKDGISKVFPCKTALQMLLSIITKGAKMQQQKTLYLQIKESVTTKYPENEMNQNY